MADPLPQRTQSWRVVGCVLCDELDDPVAELQTPTMVAVLDAFPVTPGHVLVIPRRHVESFFDLADDELRDAWRLLAAAKARQQAEDPMIEGFNIGVNVGEVAGQTVGHVHIHVIPRRRGDIPDPRGGVRGVIPARKTY